MYISTGPPPGVNFYVDDVNVYGPEPNTAKTIAKPTATGEIDVNKRYQKIEGLGASGAFRTMEFVKHKQKAELYNLLFKELGIDIFRIRNTYDIQPGRLRFLGGNSQRRRSCPRREPEDYDFIVDAACAAEKRRKLNRRNSREKRR